MTQKTEAFSAKAKKSSNFREIKKEIKKISWPDRIELIRSTKIVIGSTFIFALLIYFADLFLRNSVLLINWLFRLIG